MAYSRLSININKETVAALESLSAQQDATVTEIVRRAIGVYKYLCDETNSGKRLQLVDSEEILTLKMV